MIKINNWSSYQSYKDRKPPWIRFHKTMLDNFEYHAMSADSRALLPMLWLLASEDDDPVSGLIRCSYEKIAFRLRMQLSTLKKCITELQENSFLQVIENKACNETVTKPYPNRNQTVTPETETETDITPIVPLPDWMPLDDWHGWIESRKKKPTPRAIELSIKKLEDLKNKGHEPKDVLQQSIINGWTGLFETKKPASKTYNVWKN